MADVKTIRVIPSEILTSADTGQTTLRGTSASLPYNTNLLKRLQAIMGDNTYDSNLFDNEGFVPEEVSIEDLQRLLTQVVIRFDNDPNYYTKRDYLYLVWYLCRCVQYLEDLGKEQGLTLIPGSGIQIEDEEISAVWTDEEIKPTVTVGGLTPNDTIKLGDSIISILKKIINKTIGLTKVEPTVSLSGKIASVEYGTPTAMTQLTVSLNLGKYTSADITSWNQTYSMNCNLETVTMKVGGVSGDTIAASGTSQSVTIDPITLTGRVSISASVQISKNTAHYEDNQGNTDESLLYQGGTKSTNTITVTPYYNSFIGTTSLLVDGVLGDAETIFNQLSASDIRNMEAVQVPYSESKTVIKSTMSVAKGTGLIIAYPATYKIRAVYDALDGNDIKGAFILNRDIQVPCGSTLVNYRVSMLPAGTASYLLKDITLDKK